jgi:copper chaperone
MGYIEGEIMSEFNYDVVGMTCGHCEKAVAEEVGQVAGVQSVDVSASEGRLVVRGDDSVADADVIAAVEEAGYAATRA